MTVTNGQPLRMALIGAGFIGNVHAENLDRHRGVDFALVFDASAERAEDLASRYGTRSTDDPAQAFDRDHIDAVLIASSTDTHVEFLERAAKAGIPALCEKPIDLDFARATSAVETATASGTPAMVDFNRRFDRDYAELHRAVAAGEIGEVELVQLTSRGPTPPPIEYIAISGGQMRDQAIHFFDLARWITGLEPTEAYATGSTLFRPDYAEHGDVDTSIVSLRLSNGALVQIDCSRRAAYGYDERIEVMGSEGMIEARRHRDGAVTRYRRGETVDDAMHAGWFERLRPSYLGALEHFVEAVARGDGSGPGLIDGLRAQAIAEAATRSLQSGRSEPIDYPEIARLQ